MTTKKSLKFSLLLSLLITLLQFTSTNFAQQEERSLQPQLTRDKSLFPLQSTGIWTEVHPLIPRVDYWGVDFVNEDTGWAVGEGGAIIKTTNGGDMWIWYESGVENTIRTVSSVNNGQRVIAAGDGGMILISEDAGETWNTIPSGTTDNIWNMQMITNDIGWMVGEGGTVLKTSNSGLTWIQQPMPYPSAPYWDISFLDTLFGYVCSSSGIVLKTTNGGGNWIIQVAGDTRSLWTICAIDTLRASGGGFAGKLVYTTDGGSSWLSATGASVNANKIKFINNKGFLASDGGLYKSINGGVSWSRINELNLGSSVPQVTNISFPIVTRGLVSGGKMLLAKSTNEGESWKRTIVNADFLNIYFNDEHNGFINSANLIYTTDDGGQTLDTLLTFPYNEIYAMGSMTFSDSITGFVGTTSLRIYKTSNFGLSWYRTNIIGLTGINAIFNSIFFIDSLIGWTAVENKRPYKTADGGINWIEQINLNLYSIKDIYFSNYSLGFCTKSNDVYKTVDGGNTWFLDSLDTGLGHSTFTSYDSLNIFITGSKVFRTTNRGENWVEFPELEGPDWRYRLSLINVNSGFLVGEMGLVVKYFDDSVAFISSDQKFVNPNDFYLFQNYPNPFNPVTTIKYDLPTSSDVSLVIYDILGREVATLVNEDKPTGKYEVEFNASGLPSGIYFYQIKAVDFIETKKMILLR